jgi:hypothetical protein
VRNAVIVIHAKSDRREDDLLARDHACCNSGYSVLDNAAHTRLVAKEDAVSPTIDQKHEINFMALHDPPICCTQRSHAGLRKRIDRR